VIVNKNEVLGASRSLFSIQGQYSRCLEDGSGYWASFFGILALPLHNPTKINSQLPFVSQFQTTTKLLNIVQSAVLNNKPTSKPPLEGGDIYRCGLVISVASPPRGFTYLRVN
jgi:hypothetical protein